MSMEQIFSQLEGKITREEFDQRIKEKIEEFGGLLSEEGAALIVASELGVDSRVEHLREFPHIKDLEVGMSGISLCARVTCVSAVKEFQKKSGTGRVVNVEVADKTGSTRVVLWDDLTAATKTLKKGDIVEVKGGTVKKGYREGVEVHLSATQRGDISVIAKTEKELPECTLEYRPIHELVEDLADVDVVGRVNQFYGIREFQKNGGTGKVATLSLVDDTGEIRLCLWNDKAEVAVSLRRGDVVAVEDGYTKVGLNGLELHSGWRGRVVVNPPVKVTPLPDVERISLIHLEPGRSCDISGVVARIGEKRGFTRSDGGSGQLAWFILQDDTAEIRVVLWNEKADEIDNLTQGSAVSIDNGFVKEGIEGLEVHVSQLGQVAQEEWFTPEPKVCTLKKGAVELVGRFYRGELIDESGRVQLKTDGNIEDGQLIRVKGLYDKEVTPESIESIDGEFPSLGDLLQPPRKDISELEAGEYAEVYALVKKVIENEGYKKVKIDDGTSEIMGIVFGDVTEGEEYWFYARTYKRRTGREFVCYQYHTVEAEKEALGIVKELEALMEG